MALQGRVHITRDHILDRVDEERIFSYYFDLPVNTNDTYRNPLRADPEAGCRFYYAGNGRLYFKDFSRGDHFDCFEFVQRLYNINFNDALYKIAADLNLILSSDAPKLLIEEYQRKKVKLQIKIRKWKDSDFYYWDKYYISEVHNIIPYLGFMGVIPASALWIGNTYYRCKDNDPCYAYVEEQEVKKLYFPFRGKYKFIQSDTKWLQGYSRLPETGENLVITKSYKDVICLRLFGIHAVAPQSETVLISEEQFTDLYNRFDNIYSLMDNDRAGMHMAWLLRKKYEIPALLFPKDMKKDFSDNLEEMGIVETQEMINYYLERL